MYVDSTTFNILIGLIAVLLIIVWRYEIKLRKVEKTLGLLNTHAGNVDKAMLELFDTFEALFKTVDSEVKKREREKHGRKERKSGYSEDIEEER